MTTPKLTAAQRAMLTKLVKYPSADHVAVERRSREDVTAYTLARKGLLALDASYPGVDVYALTPAGRAAVEGEK